MKPDIEIARAGSLKPIATLAEEMGLPDQDVIPYGRTKAKVSVDALQRLTHRPDGKYVVVTAITPTPLGEGKTTVAVGLTQGLARIGRRAAVCLRQPSMGPTFSIKGGAAGGGYSQVIPMEDINLHLTGDIHAIAAAHNLCAAALDARLMHERNYPGESWKQRTASAERPDGLPRLDINPYTITWNRIVDANDRALRNVLIGLGSTADGFPRQAGYDIAVASEIMAILALVNGNHYAEALHDLRTRMGKIVVAYSHTGKPITTEDLGVAGAMTVLMKEAINPNLLQTLEGQPAFVHAGPFANIAHGASSVLADRIALKTADIVITEAGFGADIGLEKFFNIKCRASGVTPDAVVMVSTIRALKMHGGGPAVRAGYDLPNEYVEENLPLLEKGLSNLTAHLAITRQFGIPVVSVVNRFPTDTPAEIALVEKAALEAGASHAVSCNVFSDGGAGAIALAKAVSEAVERHASFSFLYPASASIREKIHAIATRIYGAKDVSYSPEAEKQMQAYEDNGFGDLPICMAKTHLSLSHDPSLKGAPKDFTFPIREIRASVGAGFIYPIGGDMRTMPGLPAIPAFMRIDIDEHGETIGLS